MRGRIAVSVDGGVATVTIDNPSQRNAVTRAMCLALQEWMPRLDADPDVVIVTIRGAGDSFCAGAALGEIRSILLDPVDGSTVDHLSRADMAITSVTKPTVALVDGACMGGGWQIASACDFIIASERSLFGITPARLGVLYPRPGIERLVSQVGPAVAKYILFSGQTFGAARASDLGLIADVVADADFPSRCDELIASLLRRSQFSVHSLKRLVDLTVARSAAADAEWEAAWLAMDESPDLAIGVDAFLQRTEPLFTWRPPAPLDSRSS